MADFQVGDRVRVEGDEYERFVTRLLPAHYNGIDWLRLDDGCEIAERRCVLVARYIAMTPERIKTLEWGRRRADKMYGVCALRQSFDDMLAEARGEVKA